VIIMEELPVRSRTGILMYANTYPLYIHSFCYKESNLSNEFKSHSGGSSLDVS